MQMGETESTASTIPDWLMELDPSQPYLVVEFVGNSGSDVIPVNWLKNLHPDDDGIFYSFFPKNVSKKRKTRYAKNQEKPHDDWEIYPCRGVIQAGKE